MSSLFGPESKKYGLDVMTGIEQRDYDGLSKSNWNSAMSHPFARGSDFSKSKRTE
jgi:hypothetical protein